MPKTKCVHGRVKDCPYSICECGDYKSQHDTVTGRCNFRTHGIADRKYDKCEKFKYASSECPK